MQIPIELFLGFIGAFFAFFVLGLVTKKPVFSMITGILVLSLTLVTTEITFGSFSNLVLEQVNNSTGVELDRSYIYNVNFTQDVQLSSTMFGAGEFAGVGSSLIGQSFQCMELLIARTSTLPDNPLYIGVMNTTGHLTLNMTTLNPTDVMTDAEQYEACLPTNTYYTIQLDDRIGAKSIIMAGSRSYIMYQDNSNPYDGIVSYRQGFNQGTGVWSGATNNDMTMKLYNITSTEVPILETTFQYEIERDVFQFTEFHKTIFALFSTILMIVSAILWRSEQTGDYPFDY